MEERKLLPLFHSDEEVEETELFTGEYGPEVHQVLIPDSLAALGKHTQKTSLRSVLTNHLETHLRKRRY